MRYFPLHFFDANQYYARWCSHHHLVLWKQPIEISCVWIPFHMILRPSSWWALTSNLQLFLFNKFENVGFFLQTVSSEPCTFQVILASIISTCHAHNQNSIQNWRVFFVVFDVVQWTLTAWKYGETIGATNVSNIMFVCTVAVWVLSFFSTHLFSRCCVAPAEKHCDIKSNTIV